MAAQAGVDALIVADIGVLRYASDSWPDLRLHLSVQGSATNPEAISFYHRQFGIQRARVAQGTVGQTGRPHRRESPGGDRGVRLRQPLRDGRRTLSAIELRHRTLAKYLWCLLPRLLMFAGQKHPEVERCASTTSSSTATAERRGRDIPPFARVVSRSPTTPSMPWKNPPASIRWISCRNSSKSGVSAIKIEGRQRSPAYVAEVTRVMRAALDALARDPGNFKVDGAWMRSLGELSEGTQTTLGAYHRPWM